MCNITYRNALFTSKKFVLPRTATRKVRINKTKKEPAFFVEYVALEDGGPIGHYETSV